jgi:predicted DsbA family dithiol-disulfide isomerase
MAIQVTHYSDILCIWAYASQARLDQLHGDFGDQVNLDCRLFSVFGNVYGKIEKRWQEKGGAAAYNQHVMEITRQFEHITVNPKIFLESVPRSSLPGHLYLYAVKVAESKQQVATGSYQNMCWQLRKAFFTDLIDIADSRELNQLLEASDLPISVIKEKLTSGEAHALLAQDIQEAHDKNVRASPTIIFNEDRQRLTGNVGYRIIEANIRELLNKPTDQQSWC